MKVTLQRSLSARCVCYWKVTLKKFYLRIRSLCSLISRYLASIFALATFFQTEKKNFSSFEIKSLNFPPRIARSIAQIFFHTCHRSIVGINSTDHHHCTSSVRTFPIFKNLQIYPHEREIEKDGEGNPMDGNEARPIISPGETGGETTSTG